MALDTDTFVDVLCCVFPDGTTRWTEADLDKARAQVSNWQEENANTWTVGCTMGFVQIRMPKEIFDRVAGAC